MFTHHNPRTAAKKAPAPEKKPGDAANGKSHSGIAVFHAFAALCLALLLLTLLFAFLLGTRAHGEAGLRLSWCCPRCVLTEALVVSIVSTANIYLLWRAWSRHH
jgi:hypothetical protein